MRPVVRGLMDKYRGRVEFLVLDYDDSGLASYRSKYKIGTHPAFAVVSGTGAIVANFVGVVPNDKLEEALIKALG